MEPWRWWAQASADSLKSPYSLLSFAPNANKFVAGFDLMLRLTKRYGRPEFAIKHVDIAGHQADIHEDVLLDKPFCRLLHFRKSRAIRNEPKVLIFAPLSGHFATLLRDTVRTMLPHHDVTITDWKDAREVPFGEGAFHFDDYVAYVQEFVRFMQK